jgi:hypothetical protein
VDNLNLGKEPAQLKNRRTKKNFRACLEQRNRKHRNDRKCRKNVGVNSQNRGIKKHRKDNEGAFGSQEKTLELK